MLERLGVYSFEIRQLKDIDRDFDGLIILGGESTVQGKLIRDLSLFEPLKKKIAAGLPVLGTCAEMILLAENIDNDDNRYFATMPLTVKRNAYARQLSSFYTEGDFDGKSIPMTFIRAPYTSVPGKSQILSTVDGKVVAARYENQLAVAFNPELNDDPTVHKYFIDMIK